MMIGKKLRHSFCFREDCFKQKKWNGRISLIIGYEFGDISSFCIDGRVLHFVFNDCFNLKSFFYFKIFEQFISSNRMI